MAKPIPPEYDLGLGAPVRMSGIMVKEMDRSTRTTTWREAPLPSRRMKGNHVGEYSVGVVVGVRNIRDGVFHTKPNSKNGTGGSFVPSKIQLVYLVSYNMRKDPAYCTKEQVERWKP